jgi:hypothetical protein
MLLASVVDAIIRVLFCSIVLFYFFLCDQSVDHGRGCFSAGFEIGTAKDRREMRQWKCRRLNAMTHSPDTGCDLLASSLGSSSKLESK